MAVTPDTSNTVSMSFAGGTSPTPLSVTIAGSVNHLYVEVATDQAVTQNPPSALTYGGVSLTLLGHQSLTSNYRGDVSVWYLHNPALGTANLQATTPNTNTGFAMTAIPMSGVNTSLAPVLGTPGSAGSGTTATCSTSGAGANDLQVAACWIRGSTISSGGAPQSVVTSTPTLPLLNINSLDSFSCDSIPGTSPGNFSWTFASNNWIALGATIFGTGAVSPVGVSLLNSMSPGPSLAAPFNIQQFRSFPYSAVFSPIPLSLNLQPGTYNLTGQPLNLTLGPLPPNVTVRQITKSGGRVVLPSKKQGETITYNFNFISALAPGETLQSAVVRANVWSGTDSSPNAIVSGPPSIVGTSVANNITGGVLGVIYYVVCAATTSLNQIIELAGYIAITPDVP